MLTVFVEPLGRPGPPFHPLVNQPSLLALLALARLARKAAAIEEYTVEDFNHLFAVKPSESGQSGPPGCAILATKAGAA